MAGLSIGTVGAGYNKAAYDKMKEENNIMSQNMQESTAVWVNKRYIPTDLRHTAPVPRCKLMCQRPTGLPSSEMHWMKPGPVPLSSFQRENGRVFISHPSTRCEEWSTLRQMLPSRGYPLVTSPPNWGTGNNLPPITGATTLNRVPKVNSPMTR